MPRIPHGPSPAKFHAIACCICEEQHPEDPTTGRMAAHMHQGRKCLGGDIPFAKHAEEPGGKLLVCAFPQEPWANRTRAILLAQGYFAPDVIARAAAEPAERDHHPLWWLERMMWHAAGGRLKRDIEAAQNRPRLVERRAT